MSNQQSGRRHSREDALEQRSSGCLAPPVNLHLFPGIPFEYVEILKTKGIEHSGNLLDATETNQQRTLLARITGIPAARISELRSLCDLTRIRGIEPRLARVIYYTKIRSVQQMASESPAELHQKITNCSGIYSGLIGSVQEEEIDDLIQCARIIDQSDATSPD